MLPMRWAVVLCAVAVPLIWSAPGSAQGARAISGTVYDDRAALAVRANFVPAAGATVKLYRDGGDRTPSADDAVMGTATTNAKGAYAFPSMSSGDYWVAVDSRTVHAGKTALSTTWAEQTFGPSGSICARQDGTTRTTFFEGSCVGGRTVASDDASSLMTSEHVALVSASDTNSEVDFAFSFNIVTSTADGDRIQGSFRQFLTNANAIGGPSRMRFVPLTPAPEQRQPIMGVPTQWWSIVLLTPLPDLSDDDTVIDGTAYNLISPASVLHVNPGRLGETATVRPLDRSVPLIEKPELELLLNGATGIICATRCGIRSVALHGSPTSVVTRADARIEQVMIGASPDGVAAEPGTIGLQIEKGVAFAQHVMVTAQTRAGLLVAPEGRLDGQHLEINRCGDPETGGGIILLSEGSEVRNSVISANPGAGIIVGSLDGATPANGNTIASSTISSNQAGVLFGPGSSRNIVTRNDIMWNRLGGVTSAPFEKSAPPRENRLSANRFDENGLRPIILDLATEDPNELTRSAESCERRAGAPNNGISSPRLTEVRVEMNETEARVTVGGKACAGEIVEIYQSFVTSGVRDKVPDLPRIRSEKLDRETLTNDAREMALPSIGEFNYLGSTNAAADGTFEATFPLPIVIPTDEASKSEEETKIWANQVLQGAAPADRAFAAIAIDAAGNTSEMSVRRQVD